MLTKKQKLTKTDCSSKKYQCALELIIEKLKHERNSQMAQPAFLEYELLNRLIDNQHGISIKTLSYLIIT